MEMKKVLLLIDTLDSGGAERQMALLAREMSSVGVEVTLVIYYDRIHFEVDREKVNLIVLDTEKTTKLKRFLKIRSLIISESPSHVIAFKTTPCMYAELIRASGVSYKLISSERNVDLLPNTISFYLKTMLHSMAKYVVCNSESQSNILRMKAPWLKNKIQTITNGLDRESFPVITGKQYSPAGTLKIAVLARFSVQKNPKLLVAALDVVRNRFPNLDILVNWYGNRFFNEGEPTGDSVVYLEVVDEIERLNLKNIVLHDPVDDVSSVLMTHDSLCIVSDHEGYSNVAVEAISCGLPVIATDVGDNSNIVNEGVTGFVIPSRSKDGLVSAMLKLCELTADEKARMGEECKRIAVQRFSAEEMCMKYVNLLSGDV